MQFVDLSQRSTEWLAWRQAGITATESAVVLGRSPYKTPWRLWCEKTGRALPPNLDQNPLVQYGIEHEAIARQLFEAKHCEVVIPACAEFSADPIFRASFDGLTANMEPIEIKCPSKKTLEEVRALKERSTAFQLYYVQVQHQMLVAEAQNAWLVFFDGDTSSLEEFHLQRDEQLIQEIQTKGRQFWDLYLSHDQEPPKDPERDVFVPKGQEVITQWCQRAGDYQQAAQQAVQLQRQLDEIKNTCTRCKQELIQMMGEFRYADFAGVSISKRVTKGSLDLVQLQKLSHLTAEQIDSCRRKPTESWVIRPTGSSLPTDFVDPQMKADIEAAIPSEAMWY